MILSWDDWDELFDPEDLVDDDLVVDIDTDEDWDLMDPPIDVLEGEDDYVEL